MIGGFLIWLNSTQLFLFRRGPDGRRQVSWRVWVLIFVMPVVFLGAAAVLAFQSASFVEAAKRTTGEVVRVYAWESSNPWDGDHTVYSPVFRYTFAPGDVTEASSGMSSKNWNFPVGSRQEILFDPTRKGDIGLDNFEYLWALPVTIAVIGLVTLVPALVAAGFVLRWLRRGGVADMRAEG